MTEEVLQQAERLLISRRLGEAAACFERAEQLGAAPDYCAGRRWTCHMLAGDYELAWQESDAIRARGGADEHRVWDGTPLTNRSVMVRSVHGFGDAVQMLRYAPLIRRDAARLTVQLAPPLVEVARSMPAIDEVVPWGEERSYDVQVEITELPYAFRSTLETLPATVPYLYVNAQQLIAARSIVGVRKRPRIGLIWSSSAWDSTRSIPFHLLHPLLQVRKDIEFWCMQPGAPEWDDFSRQQGWLLRRAGDYPATTFAACIKEMDLVITTDTFAAHVAGALAKPAWVLLKHQADWRWMIGRDDSPWYPTLRLFRQSAEGAWESVIAEVAQRLLTWTSSNVTTELRPSMFEVTSGGA